MILTILRATYLRMMMPNIQPETSNLPAIVLQDPLNNNQSQCQTITLILFIIIRQIIPFLIAQEMEYILLMETMGWHIMVRELCINLIPLMGVSTHRIITGNKAIELLFQIILLLCIINPRQFQQMTQCLTMWQIVLLQKNFNIILDF